MIKVIKKKVMRAKKQKDAEVPAELRLWVRDGLCLSFLPRVAANMTVSIGRTNSERALGFVVANEKQRMEFVLDGDQVTELVLFLQYSLPRLLKPLGRKPKNQMSVAAAPSMIEYFDQLEREATSEC